MWASMKVSINARTLANLNEIMVLTNQVNHTHCLNIMVSKFLDDLKSYNHSNDHTKKGSNRNVN